MKLTIWQSLPKPIFMLAPMEEVTDTVFRQIVARCGKPDLFVTEFTNVEGMDSRGRDKVIHRLQFTDVERPIIAQLWGLEPEKFKKAAQDCVEMGFDGIDLNMGCPVKNVMKRGSCSALIHDHPLAKELIAATKEGAGTLPVSVKTRIGLKDIETEAWVSFLLDQDIAALTIHGRTVKEQSAVPAHWDEIAKAVGLRNDKKVDTLIIGNGDVKSLAEAKQKVKDYGVDGVMIGRGIFEDPWLFSVTSDERRVTREERLQLLLDHARLFDKTWGKTKNFAILRRFFKIYLKDFEGAHELRGQLMQASSLADVETIIAGFSLGA